MLMWALLYTNRVALSIQTLKVLSLSEKGKKTVTELMSLLRSDSTFDFKTPESEQFHEKSQVVRVRTLEIKSTIQDICAQRNNSWTHAVMTRIENLHDLPASDNVYHRQSSTNFITFKQISVTYRDVRKDDNLNPSKQGIPSDTF